MQYKLILFLCFYGIVKNTYSQIKLDNSQSADFYVKNVLLGAGIEVGEVKHIGMVGGLGQFDDSLKILGVRSGLVLSTGNVNGIVGPNDSPSSTTTGKLPKDKIISRLIRRGDKDLNLLCKRKTVDITVIEFEFVPINNILEFNYVFASEEYPEYSKSQYNDVFGFFLSGAGIDGKVNLAFINDRRGNKFPISINTVNPYKHRKYYRSNSGFAKRSAQKIKKWWLTKVVKNEELIKKNNAKLFNQIQFDGLTIVLKVSYNVIPYEKYKLKIAIGDVSDAAFDSAVFLEAGSFVSVIDTSAKYYDVITKLGDDKPNPYDIVYKNEIGVMKGNELIEEESAEILTEVFFDSNSTTIPDSAHAGLNELAKYLEKYSNVKCYLTGYTDNIGSKKSNQSLSEKRALVIKKYLIESGIAEDRIIWQGNNFTNPKSLENSENGRAKNRRVEITIE